MAYFNQESSLTTPALDFLTLVYWALTINLSTGVLRNILVFVNSVFRQASLIHFQNKMFCGPHIALVKK